ncbi:MAG: oxidoreductase [Bacteroidetes bacterium]|nr:MAG: oxidoreductase [Bacteroidota bacterium]
MKTAIIVGASGLVGSELLNCLLADPNYSQITVLVRQKLAIENPKLYQKVIDFDKISERTTIFADHAFCCLGTTMKQAGSKEAFYKVDFTYAYEFAKFAFRSGIKKFLIVTAMGADAKSMIYYNRVKGEIEQKIIELDFDSLQIIRPSLLLGKRKNPRIGEDFGKIFGKIFSFLIPKRYQAIEGAQVAKALWKIANKNLLGNHIHESDKLYL